MVAKHVMRYLHGIVGYGLKYITGGEVMFHGYTESDWERSVVDRKSTSECFLAWDQL